MNNYIWIRSRRKSAAIEINERLETVLRTPYGVTREQADAIIEKNGAWIREHKARMKLRQAAHPEPDAARVEQLRRMAHAILPERVQYFAQLMGVAPTGIKITSARKRFGSCSGKNSICFSLYLMQYPQEAIDYVVVHELSHIRHKNHSRDFYREIEKILPDYRAREKLLRQ